jgi:hypothetical protein
VTFDLQIQIGGLGAEFPLSVGIKRLVRRKRQAAKGAGSSAIEMICRGRSENSWLAALVHKRPAFLAARAKMVEIIGQVW